MDRSACSLLAFLAAGASAAVLACVAIYVVGHDSRHTGFEPWYLGSVFGPTLLLGLVLLVRRGVSNAAIAAFLTGLCGLLVLLYLDYFAVLLQYDRWIERGMP